MLRLIANRMAAPNDEVERRGVAAIQDEGSLSQSHRLPPRLTEDATRDRSIRLLEAIATNFLE